MAYSTENCECGQIFGGQFSTRFSFSRALNDMPQRAKKRVICIFELLWSIGERSPSIFFKLFDSQIQPMLSYGAEGWGFDVDTTSIERTHLFALKRFPNTSLRNPNVMVCVETGRYPLFVNISIKCNKFWLRIL